MKKEKTNKYEKGVIIVGIIIAIILLIFIIADGIKNSNLAEKTAGQPQEQYQYTTRIGNVEYPIDDAVTNPANVPVLSAGMIPIKWNGNSWEIAKSDKTWYDYENGTPAYMMLNDGVYQSELVVDMRDKKLSKENIEQVVETAELGSIYMWVPRFIYNEEGEILYIKQEYVVAGSWTTPDVFMYETEITDFSLSGVWVEYKTSSASTKVDNMNKENNKYGIIANTISCEMEEEDRASVEKYVTYIGQKNNVEIPKPMIKSIAYDYVERTILKIVNTNKTEPIKAKATSDEISGVVEITVTYSKNEISKIIIDGRGSTNELQITNTNGKITANTEELNLKNGWYTITIVDNKGNSKSISVEVKKDYSKFYGMQVTNYTCPSAGVATWRVFHIDDDENIYLIADDYVAYSYMPTSTDGSTKPSQGNTSYKIQFSPIISKYTGSAWIRANTNPQAIKWLTWVNSYPSSTNANIKATAYMMDTNQWSSFAGDKAEYAIGCPTIELFCASYKVTHPDKYIMYDKTTKSTGYQIKWSDGSTYGYTLSGLTSDFNSIYVKSDKTKANGIWFASPSSGNVQYLEYLNYNGTMNGSAYNRNDLGFGFRPVVCLKSGVKLVNNGNNTCSIAE